MMMMIIIIITLKRKWSLCVDTRENCTVILLRENGLCVDIRKLHHGCIRICKFAWIIVWWNRRSTKGFRCFGFMTDISKKAATKFKVVFAYLISWKWSANQWKKYTQVRSMFNTCKWNCMWNLVLFWQCSSLTKNHFCTSFTGPFSYSLSANFYRNSPQKTWVKLHESCHFCPIHLFVTITL